LPRPQTPITDDADTFRHDADDIIRHAFAARLLRRQIFRFLSAISAARLNAFADTMSFHFARARRQLYCLCRHAITPAITPDDYCFRPLPEPPFSRFHAAIFSPFSRRHYIRIFADISPAFITPIHFH
jgi:hypothetical protein